MSEDETAYQVITANRLADGLVVYLRGADDSLEWCTDITKARTLETAEVEAFLVRAGEFVDNNEVIDPYAFEVINKFEPLTQREVTRAHGPTIRYGTDAHGPDGPDFTI